jgi:DNA-binding CsgD family transcriptional regulator
VADADVLPAEPETDPSRFGQSSLAYVVVNDECRCLDASDEACRILAVTRDRIVGSELEELLAAKSRQRFTHVWRAFREGGGRAGPFAVNGTGSIEIDVSVTADVLPSRHLVLLSSAASERRRTARRATTGAPAARRRPPPEQPSPSSREREILRMLAAGGTDEQIAERLSLSPATVRTHVRNARAKLGACTRAQAVAIALERKLIEPL